MTGRDKLHFHLAWPGTREGWGGRYLPPHPSAPPRPNLDRPVWGPYNALRPYRSRGKEAAAAASFPLGEGLGWTNVQPRLMLVWAYLNLYPDHHFTRGRGRTLGQGHCHWYVCRPDLLFGHPWTRYHMSLWFCVVKVTIQTKEGRGGKMPPVEEHVALTDIWEDII